MKLKLKINHALLVLTLVPLFVYLPAFMTEFGMHNDYRMLACHFKDRTKFPEFEHLYAVGRPLQAVLLNWQSWCIEKTSDFAPARFVTFLFMLGFAGLFFRFLRRRLGIDTFWSSIIVLGIMMLPSSQIYVLWVANFLPGFFALFLAIVSYLFLDRAFQKEAGKRVLCLISSALAFLAALFTYPMNAVFVFVCTFSVLFFSPWTQGRQTLKVVLRDIFFYGCGMIVYYLSNLFIFVAHAPSMSSVHYLVGTTYEFHMTFKLLEKGRLLTETFTVALAGTGHSFFGNAAAVINAIIIVLGTAVFIHSRPKTAPFMVRPPAGEAGIGFGPLSIPSKPAGRQAGNSRALAWVGSIFLGKRKIEKRDRGSQKNTFHFFILFLAGIGLFILINAPTLMAKGCSSLPGYRVIFPASAFILVCEWGLWQKCACVLKKRREALWLKGFAMLFVFLVGLMAFVDVQRAAQNYNRELNIIRTKAASAELKNKTRVMIVTLPPYSGENLVNRRKVPFEFGYMITAGDMAAPIVNEAFKKRGIAPLPLIKNEGNIVFFDPYTYLIDVNEARPESRKPGGRYAKKPSALVTTSSSAKHHIEISQGLQGAVYFSFQEIMAQGQFPFWVADADDERAPWIQLDFQEEAQILRRFTFGVYAPSMAYALPVNCRLEGSMDGKRWVALNVRNVLSNAKDKNLRMYEVTMPVSYKMYRFYLENRDLSRPLLIARMHMMFRLD